MNRIEKKFAELRKQKRKAFIAFITAGYPNLASTEKLIAEFERVGVDIVELGVPFSDPLADGKVIQEASQKALEKGVNLEKILGLVKRVRKSVKIPLCLMTYYNPIFCFGQDRFIAKALACGVDGLLIPDLPPEEGLRFMKSAHRAGVDVICFLSPTSTPRRMRSIAQASRGFIYYICLTGVTGMRSRLPADIKKNIQYIKKHTRKPVCVGFGVSRHSHVAMLKGIADGVIVGSAIVKKLKESAGKKDFINRVGKFVKALKG